ncbi:MAG TPA: diacylglycerol kinase family protein [Planctomycetaceae bacterium]|nr:diacylglycerol kinase family protein [Planctomycetaceae bacterium]
MNLRKRPEWIAILRNPISGNKRGKREILHLVRALQKMGRHVRLFSNRERLLSELLHEENLKTLKCLVVAGGDGTINDALNRYPRVPIAVFPTGTENLLAKHLGMPKSGALAARIIAEGHLLEFDIPTANGRKFVLMASCGIDAEVVHLTHARRTGHITKFSYLQPILASLRKYQYPVLRVIAEGIAEPYRGALLMAANFPCYALQFPFAREASPFDGVLDLRLFEKGSRLSTISYAISVLLGRHDRRKDVRCLQGRSFRIESDVPVPLQLDGDPFGHTPVDLELGPDRAALIVPENYFHQTLARTQV